MPSLTGTLTQTVADTTITSVVQTGITDFTRFGIKVVFVSFVLDPVIISEWSAGGGGIGQYIEASVTTDTSGLDFTFGYGIRQATGPIVIPITDRLVVPPSIPVIVDKTVSIRLRSKATASLNSVIYKLFYEKVLLTETEIAILNEIVYV